MGWPDRTPAAEIYPAASLGCIGHCHFAGTRGQDGQPLGTYDPTGRIGQTKRSRRTLQASGQRNGQGQPVPEGIRHGAHAKGDSCLLEARGAHRREGGRTVEVGLTQADLARLAIKVSVFARHHTGRHGADHEAQHAVATAVGAHLHLKASAVFFRWPWPRPGRRWCRCGWP